MSGDAVSGLLEQSKSLGTPPGSRYSRR